MDNTTSSSTQQQQQQLPHHEITRLIKTLEHATTMSRQLQTTSDPTHIRLILTSLHSANISLSSFLDAANSVEEDDTMMVVDSGGDVEEVDKVEEELRELLFIQNKRPKRKAPLSPSSSSALKAEREREEFDPDETRLRSFDLVYQFHA